MKEIGGIKKKAQMKLSFGMIFSIILIIFFVGFAFFAIKKFLDIQKSVEVGQFTDQLQETVDNMWKGSQGSQEITLRLPEKIELVCFGDYTESRGRGRNEELFRELNIVFFEDENLIFYPVGSGSGLDSTTINHLDIEKMTTSENPFCVENQNGEVNMVVKKNFGETLVTITR